MAASPARRNNLRAVGLAAALVVACGSSRAGIVDAPVPLPSYHAIYAMQVRPYLHNDDHGQSAGRMVMEWIDSCDGYSLHQRYVAEFQEDEQSTRMDINGVMWESKTGGAFHFDLNQSVNDQLVESVRGQADRKTVAFETPQGATLTLPGDVVFPAQFTRQVIATARRGQHFLSARLFEGSADDPFPLVTAWIGSEQTAAVDAAPMLAGQRSWMVSLSYFVGNGDTGPEYTLRSRLYENGISDNLLFDYPDFVMTGTLVHAEPLAAPDCK